MLPGRATTRTAPPTYLAKYYTFMRPFGYGECMAAQLRTVQLSLRISARDLDRVREVAHSSGATVAQFVREAVSDKCTEVEHERRQAIAAALPAASDRLTRSERLMLAAVTRDAGLSSIAATSRATGLSWSAANAALASLAKRGAIRQRTSVQSWRDGVRERSVWEPVMSLQGFEKLWAQARRVRLPSSAGPREYVGPLPPQFWSLFWNHPDPSSLALPADAEYIANRLFNGPSAQAALWASVRLPVDALQSCLRLRSTQPRTRDLIKNALVHRSAASS